MNEYGELMMEEDGTPTQSDIGWILPVSRLQNELGIGVAWNPDGSADLLRGNGVRTKLIIDDGLTFIPWGDFQPIRMELGKSHKNLCQSATLALDQGHLTMTMNRAT